jgi:vitamin B12/bleomycin/antimicrobial peptide transport system ATP-binding/permease protein
VPQRPYIPLGTLRDAVAYPVEGKLLADDRARAVIKDVGLAYLSAKLDDKEPRWDQMLSGGERQRVALRGYSLKTERHHHGRSDCGARH